MSAENGHLPEGATIATLDMLRKANVAFRELPRLSAELGQKVVVKIRAIRPVKYMEFLPPTPAVAGEWPKEDDARAAAYRSWLDTLPEADRLSREKRASEVAFRVLAEGLIDPEVTVETAQELASDADYLSMEILMFSGIVRRVEKEAEQREGDPAPVAE